LRSVANLRAHSDEMESVQVAARGLFLYGSV
jgi:hypothetical protein